MVCEFPHLTEGLWTVDGFWGRETTLFKGAVPGGWVKHNTKDCPLQEYIGVKTGVDGLLNTYKKG